MNDYEGNAPMFRPAPPMQGEPGYRSQHSKLNDAAHSAQSECWDALEKFPAFNSAHEGYAVILEELDELWMEIKAHQRNRSNEAMRREAIQVAAMALRFIMECCE